VSESLAELGFGRAGHFELMGEGSRLVKETECGSGVYAITLNGVVKYVGETGRSNLFSRFRGYAKPRGNRHKAFIIPTELKKGNSVQLWFLGAETYLNWTIVARNPPLDELKARPDRLLAERFLISYFLPEWNKDLKQVDHEHFRVT
jgi:hypothetical protein